MAYRVFLTLILSTSVAAFPASAAMAQARSAVGPAKPTSEAIPHSARMEPEALAGMIRAGQAPPVLQVGFHTLYKQGHIKGAIYAGPASTEAGRDLLRKTAAHLDHNKLLVIYCGCCPWPHCPNIHPAYQILRKMGFKNVKALYIPHNFGTDWVMLGYPTTKGS